MSQTVTASLAELCFIFHKNHVLLKKNSAGYTLPTTQHLVECSLAVVCQYPVGQAEQLTFTCVELNEQCEANQELEWLTLRQAIHGLEQNLFSYLVRAHQIIRWDRTHQFCGQCGAPTKVKDTFEKNCTQCDMIFFPRISPAIIVRVQKDQKILLARGKHFAPGAYGLIAGFIEVGETAEQAVIREVYEEVGIKIKNIRYYGSQPWPFPDSLMLAYTADFDSGEINIDYNELENAGWYDVNNMPGLPSVSLSIASDLINDFARNAK